MQWGTGPVLLSLASFVCMSFVVVAEKSLNCSLEEKRRLYACEEGFHTLSSVPTWPQYYESNREDILAFAARGA